MSKKLGDNDLAINVDELALDLAQYKLSAIQIAEKHGIAVQYVNNLRCGTKRKDVYDKMMEYVHLQNAEIIGKAKNYASEAIDIIYDIMKNGTSDATRRKAAVDILKLATTEGKLIFDVGMEARHLIKFVSGMTNDDI